MDTLISGATAVTLDGPPLKNAFIGIEGGKICYLDDRAPEEPAAEAIDASGMIVMPGLINAHTHLPMTLLRGCADDYDLQTWLNQHIFPREAKLDAESVYCATLLGIAECLRGGITSVSDMYYFCDEIARACLESGIKANLSRGLTVFEPGFDFKSHPGAVEAAELFFKWNDCDAGRIKVEMSIHGEYTSYPEAWRQISDFARQHGLGMHLHLSETQKEHEACLAKYGLTPAAALAREGVFSTRVNCAHCVWITDQDMEILFKSGATATHNPVSNLKLASGVARVPDMLKKGLNVALGTDGAASNNSLDLFEEIKLSAILHKGLSGDPTVVPARRALEFACVGGARAQGREKECGALRVGMDADIILIDASAPHLRPCHDPVSTLVYAARGGDVRLTMVRGKTLYRDGEFYTIDLERVYRSLYGHALPRVFG